MITAGKLKIYNYAKLLATITKDTVADWAAFASEFEDIQRQMLYSDELLKLDWRKEPEMYKELDMMAKEHRPFQTIHSKYRDCYELQDYNLTDVWHTNECPAYQRFLSVTHNDISRSITFIIRYEKYLKTWHISLQLPWVRVRMHPTRRLSESEMIHKETHFGTNADGTWFHLCTTDPDHAKEVLLASVEHYCGSNSLLHAVENDRQLFFCPECDSFYLPDSESGRLIKWFTETAANAKLV